MIYIHAARETFADISFNGFMGGHEHERRIDYHLDA